MGLTAASASRDCRYNEASGHGSAPDGRASLPAFLGLADCIPESRPRRSPGGLAVLCTLLAFALPAALTPWTADAQTPLRMAAPTVTVGVHHGYEPGSTYGPSLDVSWVAPQGQEIESYHLRFRSRKDRPWYNRRNLPADATTYNHSQLADGTVYEIQVRAITARRAGPWSPSGYGRTPGNYHPEFPSGLNTAFSFPADAPGGSAIGDPVTATDRDGDTLSYKLTGAHASLFDIDRSSGQLRTRPGVTYQWSRYSFKVVVNDGRGRGANVDVTLTATGNVSDRPARPAQMEPPTFSAVTGTSVEVSWTPPAESRVTGYRVRYRTSRSALYSYVPNLPASARTKKIEGLRLATGYEVEVRAVNEGGAGEWSQYGDFRTGSVAAPSGAPGAPAAPTFSDITRNSFVIDWQPPSDTGDSPIEKYAYKVRLVSGNYNGDARETTGTSALFTAYTEITHFVLTYSVRVRAKNAHGWGPWSETNWFQAPNLVTGNNPPAFSGPSEFTIPENTTTVGTVAATDGNAGDTVAYSVGGSDGALFSISEAGTLSFKNPPDFESPADASGRNEYALTVIASSGDGDRRLVATRAVTVFVEDADEAPGVPVGLAVGPATETSLEVSWTASANTGPEPVVYDVAWREGTDGTWSDGPQDVAGTNATIENLVAGTAFQVRVRAQNDEGDSDWSGVGDGATLDAPETRQSTLADQGVPDAPAPPTFSDVRASSFTVNWTAPANQGGSPISGHSVQWRVSGSNPSRSPGSIDLIPYQARIFGLDRDLSYDVRVRVENDDGFSSFSSWAVVALTSVADPVPNAPSRPTLGAASQDSIEIA